MELLKTLQLVVSMMCQIYEVICRVIPQIYQMMYQKYIADTSSIFLKKDKFFVENYRPISVLFTVS